jgi:mycothiol synthase
VAFRLRSPRTADAEAVLRVLVARDVADLEEPDYTLERLEDEWRESTFDLAADAVVAEDDRGRIVGYAIVRGPGTLVAVDPEREGEGIGTRLLEWAERRALALGRARHSQWIGERNVAGRALLQRAGYEPARSYWRMAVALDAPRPSVPVPAGVRLRRVELPTDARALYDVDAAAFAGNPDYYGEPFERFESHHLAGHDLAPALSPVAERDGAVVGFALCRCWAAGVGFVDILAVQPSEQGRGLGTALLVAAFDAFTGAGLREAQLGVASDNPRALRVYERAGMAPRFRVDVLERAAT